MTEHRDYANVFRWHDVRWYHQVSRGPSFCVERRPVPYLLSALITVQLAASQQILYSAAKTLQKN